MRLTATSLLAFAAMILLGGAATAQQQQSDVGGIGPIGDEYETLRKWVRQAEIDAGQRPGVTSEESAQLKALKKENAELRRANEILKAASAFFAAELDRPHRY